MDTSLENNELITGEDELPEDNLEIEQDSDDFAALLDGIDDETGIENSLDETLTDETLTDSIVTDTGLSSESEGTDSIENTNNIKEKIVEKTERDKTRKKAPVGLLVFCGILLITAVVFLAMYLNVRPYYSVELGTGVPDASVFMKKGSAAYAEVPEIAADKEGVYFLSLKTDSGKRAVVLRVQDTTAPTGEDANIVVGMDHRVSAEEAVKNVVDASAYFVRWKTEPKQGTPGVYFCEVEIIDACKNTGYIPVTVTILAVKEVLEWEINSVLPTANDFLAVNRNAARYEEGTPELSTSELGETVVYISLDGTTYKSTLRIVDTVAPVFNCKPTIVAVNSIPNADSLIDFYQDSTDVQFTFASEPDTSQIGSVICTIIATDEGGNQATQEVELVVCDEILELATVNYEQTAQNLLQMLGYTSDGNGDEVVLEASFTGTKFLELSSTKGVISLAVHVTDTDAPTAKAVNVSGYTLYTHTADEFVSDIQDGSPVTISFVTEPNWSLAGQQNVNISLVDAVGNETVITTKLNLTDDTTPPSIYAAIDRYCYVNEAVSYLKEVFAEDNADPDVTITVDKSQVDTKSKGTYPVTYTATDRSGNETSVTVKYTFIEQTVSDEDLEALVDRIFAKILTDDMSLAEQANAIYEYVYGRIWYTGQSDKTNWKYEAYNGLTQGVGDCFTFYAAEYLLLTHIDCQVLSVERLNGKTLHYWCLVNLGTGWYHFDACNVGPEKIHAFMKTTEELVPLSEQYWRFDKSLYPEVAKEPFEMF